MDPDENAAESVRADEAQLSELLDRVRRRRERLLIEQDGKPVAALISARDYERLLRLEAQRARDFAAINEVGAAFADVPLDELEREVAKAVAEVKQERLAERRAQQSA